MCVHTTGVPTRTQIIFHVKLRHIHQVQVLFAISVQLDLIVPRLKCPIMSLAAMGHIQIQRDKIRVYNVQQDSGALIQQSLQFLVKMEPLVLLALLNALFALQDTGKKTGGAS